MLQLLLALFVIRFVTMFAFGLGVDEAHYMLYARYIDLSYFDHPPLVGWTHYIFNQLLGENLLSARLPAYLIGVVGSIYLYLFLKERFDRDSALFGVLALNSSVMINAMFIFLLPETFLLWFVFPLIYYVNRLEESKSIKNYIMVGFWLGAMGLAKYSAIFFLLGVVAYYIYIKRADILLNYKIVFSGAVGAILISPVVIWNVAYDFVSFTYQGDNLGGGGFDIGNFFQSLGGQMSYSPLLFGLAVYGVIISYIKAKNGEKKLYLPIFISTAFLLILLYFSFYDAILPHWSAVVYMLFIPLGASYLYIKKERLAKWLVLISYAILVLILAELNLKVIPYKDYNTPFRDIAGWDNIMSEAKRLIKKQDSDRSAIAVANWTQGSRASYYYKGDEPVVVIDGRFDQFDMWEPADLKGYDLLLIDTKFKQFNKESLGCKKIVKAGDIVVKIGDVKINRADYFWCIDYSPNP